MRREIVLDVTHLVTRLNQRATTGIDRVDLAYARHFAGDTSEIFAGVHYGLFRPHLLRPDQVKRLLDAFQLYQREQDREDGPEWVSIGSRLRQSAPPKTRSLPAPNRARSFATQCGFRVLQNWRLAVPHGAIYLSVAQHAFEHHRFFEWLSRRRDVLPVFLIHDLLPLDFPEFFPVGYDRRFRRRVETMVRHARAIITTTSKVAERIEAEYRLRNLVPVPVRVVPLASPLEQVRDRLEDDHGLKDVPYFIAVSTIEPRKNHSLLINVWRALVRSNPAAPKLILVGKRGWGRGQVFRELDLAPDLQPYLIEVPSLPAAQLKPLIKNALSLLMPSFEEGYGLPIVEALSLGTPVVCSDIPVFREVSQNKAWFLSPIDGPGWLQAVESLGDPNSSLRARLADDARTFVSPSWLRYFSAVGSFLDGL